MDDEPKKRTLRWIVLFSVTGIVDVIQIIIDLTGVGVAVSELLEVIMPFVLLGLLAAFRIPILNKPNRILSIIGADVFDAITGGVAPFWIADVWYIYSDVKKEESDLTTEGEQREFLQGNLSKPLNQGGTRAPMPLSAPPKIGPANKGGFRAPGGGLAAGLKSVLK